LCNSLLHIVDTFKAMLIYKVKELQSKISVIYWSFGFRISEKSLDIETTVLQGPEGKEPMTWQTDV